MLIPPDPVAYYNESKEACRSIKCRKKPIEVEAFRWTGSLDQTDFPDWIVKAIRQHSIIFPYAGTPSVIMCIKTLEGNMLAGVGDYVILGAEGEIYPCTPSVFKKIYEPIPLNQAGPATLKDFHKALEKAL